MRINWIYLNLQGGRLVDDEGRDANSLWPSFDSFEEAEDWLEENCIRATVR